MNGTPPGSIHACHPSGWIDSEIFPAVSSFHQTYKADKRRSCYLSTGRALFTRQEPGGHYFSSRESSFASHHEMQPLDKAFIGPLKIFYCLEIEKWLRSHPGRVVTVYQIGELFGNAYKRTATGEIASNGFRVTGLFPCHKNTFRPCDFPVLRGQRCCSANHPALVKTSYQPSFISANFSPFTSAEALWSSDISPVPSLNLKSNHRGGTAKKITSSPYNKFVGATQKKKIKQATKSKTSCLASNVRLGPSKRRKRRVCRDQTPPDTSSDSDTDLAVPFFDDSTEDEEQVAYCVFCTGRFSEDRSGED